MKVLVTGGAGYIGSVVATKLVEAGHDVIVLDSLELGHENAVPKEARFIKTNITDIYKVLSPDDDIEAVLHFAAYMAAGESMNLPDKYWINNTVGSLSLLESMRKLNINKLIFSSTAAVYGNPETTPITEEARTNPTSTYGQTKLAVDMAITSYCHAYGIAATSLRYFNVAGAYGNVGERHPVETHIIPLALKAVKEEKSFNIYGNDYPTPDGTCIRDYIHIEDLADAHLLALENLAQGQHSIFNLGNGNGFSNNEVVKAIEEVTGKKLPVVYTPRREGDPAILIASSDKAKKNLGWSPKKPTLNEIVKDAWDFYNLPTS
jgi:UDP-glucose 4-epimerase